MKEHYEDSIEKMEKSESKMGERNSILEKRIVEMKEEMERLLSSISKIFQSPNVTLLSSESEEGQVLKDTKTNNEISNLPPTLLHSHHYKHNRIGQISERVNNTLQLIQSQFTSKQQELSNQTDKIEMGKKIEQLEIMVSKQQRQLEEAKEREKQLKSQLKQQQELLSVEFKFVEEPMEDLNCSQIMIEREILEEEKNFLLQQRKTLEDARMKHVNEICRLSMEGNFQEEDQMNTSFEQFLSRI